MRVNGQRFFSAGIAGLDVSRQRFWQIAILTGACTIAAAGLALAGPGASQAATDSEGCASGQTTYTSSFLVAHGFSPDFLAAVDENGDGVVCARPLSPQQQQKFCAQFPDGCQQPVILGFSDNYRGKGH